MAAPTARPQAVSASTVRQPGWIWLAAVWPVQSGLAFMLTEPRAWLMRSACMPAAREKGMPSRKALAKAFMGPS
jgi:hypothetical protein